MSQENVCPHCREFSKATKDQQIRELTMTLSAAETALRNIAEVCNGYGDALDICNEQLDDAQNRFVAAERELEALRGKLDLVGYLSPKGDLHRPSTTPLESSALGWKPVYLVKPTPPEK